MLPTEDPGIQINPDPLPGEHASKPVENDLPLASRSILSSASRISRKERE
ncbi:MAG: hypothetical protein WCZ26_03340 [Methanothrix soehngenii]